MKKLISRVCCLCCVVLVLAACLPLSAFAVDPVSAGVMANAFAQAIAAYGASNGVAMTFDVTSTDGIGESVHELWKSFRSGTQSADDYATLAAALFPDLYYKASSVVGGVSDVYTVGYNISSTYAEEFDSFFDWLLSGPAEMVKVDNSYYQFASAQIGSSAIPVNILSILPFSPVSTDRYSPTIIGNYNSSNYFTVYQRNSTSYPLYCFVTVLNGSNAVYIVSSYYNVQGQISWSNDYAIINTTRSDASYPGIYFQYSDSYYSSLSSVQVPVFSSPADGLSSMSAFIADPSSVAETVGVKAYSDTGVAQFPDTTDPNYQAVGKQIPSTVPWDNTAYGDGTGTLTDAQAGAIAAGADTVIARDGVLDLAGTDEVTDEPGVDDPPTTDPDDYAVPGLADIFPFCIPFDIYNFLSALAAEPVAPHFTATLAFPQAVGGTQTIDINFDSPTWNQLAQLLRLLELLAFIIGLALLTRSMFIRG